MSDWSSEEELIARNEYLEGEIERLRLEIERLTYERDKAKKDAAMYRSRWIWSS